MVSQGGLQLSVRYRKALWVASDIFGGSKGRGSEQSPGYFPGQLSHITGSMPVRTGILCDAD